jgi:hypothetical protein
MASSHRPGLLIQAPGFIQEKKMHFLYQARTVSKNLENEENLRESDPSRADVG